jgi:hypothetical protein
MSLLKPAISASAAAVVLAALIAIPSWAGVSANGSNVFAGETQGGKVYFKADYKRGEPKKVGHLLIVPFTLRCEQGTVKVSVYDDSERVNVPVRRRKFEITSAVFAILDNFGPEGGELGEERRFTGSFGGVIDKKGKRASGTFDFGDPVDFGAESSDCDTTGPQRWEARVSDKASLDRPGSARDADAHG